MVTQVSRTGERVEVAAGMTNFDHSIDPELAGLLSDGTGYGVHAGRNFNGLVWAEDDGYVEEVWQYHAIVAYIRALTLPELMAEVNAAYGSE